MQTTMYCNVLYVPLTISHHMHTIVVLTRYPVPIISGHGVH